MNKIVWLIVISLVCLNQVMAATVVVEPDDFSVDTDIRNSFPGATLSTTLPGGDTVQTMEEVLVRDGYDAFLNRNVATTGTSVFGQPIDPNTSSFPSQIFGQTDFGLLRADFASPASFVQIDLIFGDDGVARLWAYDSSGNELEYR
jgi:hypothetical protein